MVFAELDRQAIELDGLSVVRSGFHNRANAAQLTALNPEALPINKRGRDSGGDTLDIILVKIPYDEVLARTYGRLPETAQTETSEPDASKVQSFR